MRKLFWKVSFAVFVVTGLLGAFVWQGFLWTLAVTIPIFWLGIWDLLQRKQTIRRNFPVIGHGRYLMEVLRPEINQYFVESNRDGMPFNRERRAVIYQRAKGVADTLPFGTQTDVYAEGYEWVNHSIRPRMPLANEPRVRVGGADCKQPYLASVYNVSAMSYGSLSRNAILALNRGAKLGGFAHNTGEGGLSPHHLEPGGDITWQIGTGYFSARNRDGTFSEEEFARRANLNTVRMIEVKLSQGAKPGHGGILPAAKVTQEISEIRGVEMGKDVLSPPAHTAFTTPEEMLFFIKRLRELSGGKPIGFKLCLGKRREFMSICKAMLKTGILPDFITVDGGEGGTGAAPLEFSNSVGTPLNEALIFIHNCLVGIGVRDQIRIIVSGKVTTGFAIASKLALGADMCNAARGMMFALGCIQALKCNTNKCPTGVTTHDPDLVYGLVVSDKAQRVANYHRATVHAFLDVIAAAGLKDPTELRPWHIQRRVSTTETRHYGEIYSYLERNDLLQESVPEAYRRPWQAARAETFDA